MAFGLGFNKAKVLAAAEKYVSQGKIPNAIDEYKKTLEHEPRDLTILNIVGDLYLRINKNDEALKCFYKLADVYIENGFARNAIAVYRRISRVDPNEINAILKMADLYTAQGQLNEARVLYQQAGDYYSQRNQADKGVDVMEKILLLDPENIATKQRLAAMYEQVNRKDDASAMYLSAAEALADRGNPTDAEKVLKRAREMGLFSPEVLVLQARIELDDGRPKHALATLEQLPPANMNKAALNVLFHAHSAAGDVEQAGAVAKRLLDEHDDVAGLALVADRLLEAGKHEEALENYSHMADKLIAQRNTSPLVEGLKKIVRALPSNLAALRLLRHVYQETDQDSEISEINEQLAHAAAQEGDYAQARDLYAELARLEPENPHHRQNLQQMEARLGHAQPPPPPPPDMGFADAMMMAPPVVVEQPLSPEDQELLDTAITDSDLFLTYHQVGKAIKPLEAILDRLPRNIALNERLMDLYARSEQYEKALKVCEVLSEICVLAGDAEKASSYSDQMVKYSERVAAGPAPGPAVQEFPVDGPDFPLPEVSAGPAVTLPPEAGTGSEVREVDLSDWEAMMAPPAQAPAKAPPSAVAPPAPPAAAPAAGPDLGGAREEIEFYLQAGLISEAMSTLTGLQEKYPDSPEVQAIAEKVVAASMTAPAPAPASEATPAAGGEVREFQFGEMSEAAEEAPPAQQAAPPEWPEPEPAPPPPPPPPKPVAAPPPPPPPPPPKPAAAPKPAPPPPPPPPPKPAVAHEPEFELALDDHGGVHDDAFELALDEEAPPAPAPPPRAAAPPPVQKAKAPPPPPPSVAAPSGFDSLVGALEEELSDVAPPPPAAHPPAAPARAATPAASAAPPPPAAAPAAAPGAPGGVGQLAQVFDEFKAGMEDAGAEADIETHFNMGVAFKEMHLYDEAIGEFQKAYQAAERAKSYSNFVRCCTLLAHCFMEKNLPPLAVRWLENALKAPGLEQEDLLALRYEIGTAHEMAGNKKAALDAFMEVYALNIDYRDVADRIRELQGK